MDFKASSANALKIRASKALKKLDGQEIEVAAGVFLRVDKTPS